VTPRGSLRTDVGRATRRRFPRDGILQTEIECDIAEEEKTLRSGSVPSIKGDVIFELNGLKAWW
jgi:hypothetical protein